MEEKTIEVVVDGVTISLEDELPVQVKEFLKRRLERTATFEQPGKRRKPSPSQIVVDLIEGEDEEEIHRAIAEYRKKRRRSKLNTTIDE
jgi:hypothetical protein